jgi:hypothetical protein
MAGAALSWLLRGRSRISGRLVAADAVGAAAFGLTGVLLAMPYRQVVDSFPVARRTEDMVHLYSPPVRGLLTAPPESWWWGSVESGWRVGMRAVPEQALLPGMVLIGLALLGLGYSAWARRHRALLLVVVLVSAVLALGTSAPDDGTWTYLLFFRHLPGWEAMRTPGRLILWCTLALALLAAGAVTKAADARAARRPTLGWTARLGTGALLLPALLVLAEGIGQVAQPEVPRPPVALHTLPAPVLVLPTSQQGDYLVMTWSTDGWPKLVNGGSGFEPPDQSQLRRMAEHFPEPRAVVRLRADGVRTVVLVDSMTNGTVWHSLATQPPAQIAAEAVAAGIRVRRSNDALIYDLSPTPRTSQSVAR